MQESALEALEKFEELLANSSEVEKKTRDEDEDELEDEVDG